MARWGYFFKNKTRTNLFSSFLFIFFFFLISYYVLIKNKKKNFEEFGQLIEAEALELHSIMLTQRPALIYWTPGTLQIMKLASHWRTKGIPVYFTINTGQDIHLICGAENATQVQAKLKELDFVKDIIVNTPGEGARLSPNHLF